MNADPSSDACRMFNLLPFGVALVGVTDHEGGVIMQANRAFGDLLGRSSREVIGTRIWDYLHPRHRARGADEIARLVAGSRRAIDSDACFRRADGETRWLRVNAGFVRRALRGSDGIVLSVADATERRGIAEERSELALRLADAQAIARIGSFQWDPVADEAIISDQVFELFGLRPRSLPGRFAAWEPYLHPEDLALLSDAVAGTLVDGQPRDVEFRFKPHGGDFRWAEGRVHATLSGGRAVRLRGTMQDIHERKLAETRLRDDLADFEQATALRAALADGRFRLDGQPIRAVRGGETLAEELLVRLVDPGGRIVPPGEFLSVAESHGVIAEIDLWVLDQAVQLAAGGAPVTVNVSARTVSERAYGEEVVRLITERGANPALMTFEITETALLSNFDEAKRLAVTLDSLGSKLALDDFGTGYGALTYVKQLPAHYLKIDREFVRDAAVNSRSRAVIRGIVTLARSFGQQTIAEGVEERATLDILEELGVDYVQGFHIGHPHWVAGAGRGR
ncbi:MAG TPA: EAL domain-containing protein [Thermoleophilaceae bacterium]